MEMDKRAEMKKKVDEMPADEFLLLASLVKEKSNKIKKENIERTLNEINLALQKLNLDCKFLDEDGYKLSFPYLKFFYDENDNIVTLGLNN